MRPHIIKNPPKNYHDVVKWFSLTFAICLIFAMFYLLALLLYGGAAITVTDDGTPTNNQGQRK